MSQTSSADKTYRPLRLFYQVGLVTVGFAAIGVATASELLRAAIAIVVAGAFIASAFLGLPAAIVRYLRGHYGYRPNYEALYAIGAPLLLAAFSAWMTIVWTRRNFYLSRFIALDWSFIATPVIYGVMVLMNLGVAVANIISLARERRELL
jgi:hypothetical protein